MQKAIWFLRMHPAFGGHYFDIENLLTYSIQEVCKHGYCDMSKENIRLRKSPDNYKRYKKEFDEEMKNYTPEELELQGPFVSIDVPYERIYGEPWTFSHVEYWGDLCFMMYQGPINASNNDKYQPEHWQRCEGVSASANSFEDLVIKLADRFRHLFGNFTDQDFLTDNEKKNHKQEEPFFFKPVKDKKIRCSTMVRNKNFMRVTPAEINRRWQNWFLKTPYGKKNWSSEKPKLKLASK